MARDADVSASIAPKNIIEHLLTSDILINIRLAMQRFPHVIKFGKAFLKSIRRKGVVDICFVAATVTRMSADSLAEILLDLWNKGLLPRQVQSAECQIRGGKTPRQRRSVVRFRCGNLLIRDQTRPEPIDRERLADAIRC